MKKNGFTMIEFMVVAVLIGILSTLGLSTYTKSLTRGRDARRVSDMKEVQKTFEVYYSLEGNYNADCDTMFNDETGKKPQPPAGGLRYVGSCAVDEYIYCSELENDADYGNANCGDFTSLSTCTPNTANPNGFCVYSVQ